jgi:PleD family two-component response regulator
MIKEETLKNAGILIVDDQEANVLSPERLLKTTGYSNFVSTSDPRQVPLMCGKFQSDLNLRDLMIPHVDGYSVVQQIGPRVPERTRRAPRRFTSRARRTAFAAWAYGWGST